MSFLASREKLPLTTVTSAGELTSLDVASPEGLTSFTSFVAHCLYVLTDDNYPASVQIKTNAAYSSCLLEIAQTRASLPTAKGKSVKAEERAITLCVLACGVYLPL